MVGGALGQAFGGIYLRLVARQRRKVTDAYNALAELAGTATVEDLPPTSENWDADEEEPGAS